MSPVCTMMIGRLDDWMRVLVERDGVAIDPDALDWAGIAAFKRAFGLYRERGYRTRLLAAAYRHRLHWTELVGGDVILTMPTPGRSASTRAASIPCRASTCPSTPTVVDDLLARIPDFGRAYEPDGLSIAEFERTARRCAPCAASSVVPRPPARSATSCCRNPDVRPA